MSTIDYINGYKDALSSKKNLRTSKMYDLGFTEGLAKKYQEQVNQEEEPKLLDKHTGIYED